MSAASQTAAIAWRVERSIWKRPARCDRWYVRRGSRWWLVCPPCYCDGEHDEAREKPIRRFTTHAYAIAYADQQARAHVLPSTPRRRS